MTKNIVVCCDGTANEFSKDRTNVAKFFFALLKDPAQQVTYYHPGVGTMAPPGFVTKTGALVAQIGGLAFGYGLNNDIRDLYIFIAKKLETGDRLSLLGFSRGAYTVRAVAALIHMYGLIPSDNDPLVPYTVRLLWAIHSLQKRMKAGAAPDSRIAEYFTLARDFKATFSRECKPHFVGVWDTVSSVGWFANPLSLPYTANNPDINIGRHAIAIDERRAFFRTNLWRPALDPTQAGPKDTVQVWFPGVHCDVGGGYCEKDSGLSKFSLKWMIEEAKKAKIMFDDDRIALILGEVGRGFAPPDPDATLHDSMSPAWRVVEYLPRPHWDGNAKEWRANRASQRTWPARPIVHDAAWIRDGGKYAARLPDDSIRLSKANSTSPPAAGTDLPSQ